MVDAVVTVLVEKLLEGLVNEGRQMLDFNNKFEKMKKEILHMESFIKDADKVRMKDQNEGLKTVVRKIREVLYKAEDIIEDWELFHIQQRRKKFKVMSYFRLSLLKHRYQMGRRLSQFNQDVDVLREMMKAYLHTFPRLQNEEHVGSSQPAATYPILMNEAEIVGLDDDLKKIKQWVMEERGRLRVIGIVGMGGIGKTTLAEMIRNDDDVSTSFEHVLLVTVSQSFKFEELIKIMLRKLMGRNMDFANIDLLGLLEKLRQQLDGKRYLVFLDDVWGIDEKKWWESLKSALPESNSGCCVIVTTRKDAVARSMGAIEEYIHYPQILSSEESWLLFSKIAFASIGGECPNSEIERVGKEIVGKYCGGLPLAIKVVGGVMLGKGHSVLEWRQISVHLKEELAVHGEDEMIVGPLQLSYEELPPHLKPCMLSFAAFPEDYIIQYRDMVYWWIGEGFAQKRDGKTAYETGSEYFAELISRDLLIGQGKDVDERSFVSCRVHDMVRDMIIKIAREENFMGLDNWGMLCCTDRSRRVGFFRTEMVDQLREANSQLLRTLIVKDIEESEEYGLICKLKWLRVLSISFKYGVASNSNSNSKVEWWSGIGSLRHLILLQIENCISLERLPDSIGNLQNLQELCLDCLKLKRLPAQVTCLEKLSTLDIRGCDSIEYLPKGIGRLSNLESLKEFKPAAKNTKGCRLSELKTLTKLRELSVEIDSEDKLEGGELKQVLSELKQLEILSIEFGGPDRTGQMVRKVDDDGELPPPLQKLQRLYLGNYPGERTPAWLNPTTLPNLEFLRISDGKIRSMSRDFFGNNNNKVWELLETLHLFLLRKLEEDWLRMKMAMPSLRLLTVVDCPKLRSHPFNGNPDGKWRKEAEG